MFNPKNPKNEKKNQPVSFGDRKDEIRKAVDLCIAAYEFGKDEDAGALEFIKRNGLTKVMPAKHGKLAYFVAEDTQGNVYIAFRGSYFEGKYEDFSGKNFKIRLLPCYGGGSSGNYHAGFLDVANSFPMRTVISRQRYLLHLIVRFTELGTILFFWIAIHYNPLASKRIYNPLTILRI